MTCWHPPRGPSNEGHESWDAFSISIHNKSLFYDNGQQLWGMFFSFLSRSRSIAAHLIIIRSRKYPRKTGGHMMIVVWTQTSQSRCLWPPSRPSLGFVRCYPFVWILSNSPHIRPHPSRQVPNICKPRPTICFFFPFYFLMFTHTHIYHHWHTFVYVVSETTMMT